MLNEKIIYKLKKISKNNDDNYVWYLFLAVNGKMVL